MLCKHCGKKVAKTLGHKPRIFCNHQCCYKYRMNQISIGVIRKKYYRKNFSAVAKTKKRRRCLGVYCRGNKFFMSTSVENRQCKMCSLATKNHLDINEMIFTPSRSSR